MVEIDGVDELFIYNSSEFICSLGLLVWGEWKQKGDQRVATSLAYRGLVVVESKE